MASNETRLEEALEDVARIHPQIRAEYQVGASHAWYGDRWARGAFALESGIRAAGQIHDAPAPDPSRLSVASI